MPFRKGVGAGMADRVNRFHSHRKGVNPGIVGAIIIALVGAAFYIFR